MNPADLEVLTRIDHGETVVVRLPPLYQPYGPFLRHLKDIGRLVRIDRQTLWGNPFPLRRGATDTERAAMIARYRAWLAGDGPDERTAGTRTFSRSAVLARLPELRGKALACHCTPLACHGDVLAALTRQATL
ncbi:DUF4326 domain-containing protein [Candidatus Protofrankia datiscae]|uniref:DUF4326 domain-containing protein n=1 Tax=Candidatus Protofrankia datiscae TaxID=2716812 RepID=F8B0B9_9ACTN|nr:DUF4326 domain-containing protein [Candidatus Protofrankia datiscae]AEH08744.1 hypothetical protein FsymDg_1255 [Candidatus Protofrankia datiscae]